MKPTIYEFIYDDKGRGITPQFNGEWIKCTIVERMGDVCMVVPWCNGHETLVRFSDLKVSDDDGMYS